MNAMNLALLMSDHQFDNLISAVVMVVALAVIGFVVVFTS